MQSLHFIPTRRAARASAMALAVALGACSDPAAPPKPSVEAHANLDPDVGIAAAPYSNEYSWLQGQSAVSMGADSGFYGTWIGTWKPRVCYLTRVSGKFTDYSESVRVYRVGHRWYLSGTSGSVGVGGRARCMLVGSFTLEKTWSAGMLSVTIPNPSLVACFITGIAGEFYRVDGVYLERDNTDWALGGYGGDGSTTDLKVRARCAKMIGGNNADVATGSWGGGSYISLTSSTGRVCVLTEVRGSLQSSSSYLSIYKHVSDWLMVGSPATSPNNPYGKSRCYS